MLGLNSGKKVASQGMLRTAAVCPLLHITNVRVTTAQSKTMILGR